MPDVQINDGVSLPLLSVALPLAHDLARVQAVLDRLTGTQPVLPVAPRFGRAGVCTLMQDAPDHWFVRYDAGVPPPDARAAGEVVVTDITDGWITFRVRGDGARELLAQGARVDLHGDAATRCFFRTMLAEAPVLLLLHERDCEVMVPRSYSAWVHAWLRHAAGFHERAQP